jgi:hypothetical protein
MTGSNRRPSGCKPDALPAELIAPVRLAFRLHVNLSHVRAVQAQICIEQSNRKIATAGYLLLKQPAEVDHELWSDLAIDRFF